MTSAGTIVETVTLTAKTDSGATRCYKLQADQGVFAGSSSNCGLQLPGAGIADIHCRIGFEDRKLYVQSWMSAEGICVNGDAMLNKTEIGLGDVIQIGPHQIVIENRPNKEPSKPEAPASDLLKPEAPASHVFKPASPASDLRTIEPPTPKPTPSDNHADDRPASDRVLDAASDAASDDLASIDLESEFFNFDDDEETTYDAETVALLRAEIEDLQAALAQRDAELQFHPPPAAHAPIEDGEQATDELLHRMQELIDEANRSDERVALLEEMLHSSEATNRSEQEERQQLEFWVGDIEQRVAHREAEHAAEIEALRQRLEQSMQQQDGLRKKIQHAAFQGNVPKHYEETLEHLQTVNRDLQEKLDRSEQQRLAVEQQLEQSSGEQDRALREERASIAKERAKVSRLRFELSRKLAEIEEIPKPENQADEETAHRIQTLREHLREIHEQEKREEKDAPLTSRLAKLWKRVEY